MVSASCCLRDILYLDHENKNIDEDLILFNPNGDVYIEKFIKRNYFDNEDKIFMYFCEEDYSRFISYFRQGNNNESRGILITIDGNIYDSIFRNGIFINNFLMREFKIPFLEYENSNSNNLLLEYTQDDNQEYRGCLNTKLDLNQLDFKDNKNIEYTLKELLELSGIGIYFQLIKNKLSFDELIMSSKLINNKGVEEILGIEQLGHRIKLVNCIKEFRILYNKFFLPKKYLKQPKMNINENNLILNTILSNSINFYCYSGINIPFDQLIFIKKLERTEYPCICSKGDYFLKKQNKLFEKNNGWNLKLKKNLFTISSCFYLGKWLGKDVAIKVFKGRIQQPSLWENTCKLIWSLRHPCLVLTLGFCHYFPDIHCVITEYVHNGSLQKLLYKGSCICMYNCTWKDNKNSKLQKIEIKNPPYYHNIKYLKTNKNLIDNKSENNLQYNSNSSNEELASPIFLSILDDNQPFGIHIQHAIKIVKEIAIGCLYLKQRGLFHLNLKPTNILIEDDNSIKIADIGHFLLEASFFPIELNQNIQELKIKNNSDNSFDSFENEFSFFNDIVSVPRISNCRVLNYLPPEILRSSSPLLEPAKLFLQNKFENCQSIDSYSLGVILWEMINGQPPFAGLSNIQIQACVGYAGGILDLTPLHSFPNYIFISNLISKSCGYTDSIFIEKENIINENCQPIFPSTSSSSNSKLSINTLLYPRKNKKTRKAHSERLTMNQILGEIKLIERTVSLNNLFFLFTIINL